jgi:hypothetical protein
MNVLRKLTALKIECNRSEMLHVKVCLPRELQTLPNNRTLIDPFVEKLFEFGEFDLVEFFINHRDASIDEFIFVEE